jgi:uncharacterized protein YecT (DUF1311 family)
VNDLKGNLYLGGTMKFTFILLVLCSSSLFGQFTADAEHLIKLDYMQSHAYKTNCDSTGGSNIEHKICLNKQFQKADSLLNVTYSLVISDLASDSVKKVFKDLQLVWVSSRRQQAKMVSTGYRGHMLGIKYLGYMLVATENRIRELKVFLEH